MTPPPRTQAVGNEADPCDFGSTFPPSGAGWAAAVIVVLLAVLGRKAGSA